MEKRICVIAVIVEDREKAASRVNEILRAYGNLFLGRLGLPFRERDLNVISLVMEGSTDEVGAVTGKLGNIEGVRVKSLSV